MIRNSSNMLNAVGYLEVLKNYVEKCFSWTLFFNKIMLLFLNRRLLAFFQENEWKVLEWSVYSSDQNPIEIYVRFRRKFFGDSLEKF